MDVKESMAAIRAANPDPRDFVDALYERIHTMQASEIRQIGGCPEEMIRVSREIGYERGEALGLLMLGFVHFLWQRNQEALPVILEALPRVDELREPVAQAQCRTVLGGLHNTMGNYQKTLELTHESLSLLKGTTGTSEWVGWPNYIMGDAYGATGDLDRARECYQSAYDIFKTVETAAGEARALIGLGVVCRELEDYDASDEYLSEARRLAEGRQDPFTTARVLSELAWLYWMTDRLDQSEDLFTRSLGLRQSMGGGLFAATCLIDLGNLLVDMGRSDEGIERLSEALQISTEKGHEPRIHAAHEGLASAYQKKGDLERSLKHHKEFQRVKERVMSSDTATRLQSLEVSLAATAAQKEAELTKAHNTELRSKNAELARLLNELRDTQEMLIQSEKMASLGQLTAGIAHEIRNPLNFVNNFSLMTKELVAELRDEMDKHPNSTIREVEPALAELATEITENTDRILEHGRRAGQIVNSMLVHSRESGGKKTEVDLNDFVSTCVDLAHHGFLATKEDFEVDVEKSFEDGVGQVTVIEDEVIRVLTNILGNAFYAVHEHAQNSEGGFRPRISVSTTAKDGFAMIGISDNGPGIDDDLKRKIFEPFFTTKPTGSGTGLGLSQSYEIIVERHGGTLDVHDTDSGGATFVITLPVDFDGD